jgi:hypothetical protein
VESPRACPVNLEEVVEAYFMHRLPEEQVNAFEEHYFVCAHCASILQKTGAYVAAIRAALKLGSEPAALSSSRPAPRASSPGAPLDGQYGILAKEIV